MVLNCEHNNSDKLFTWGRVNNIVPSNLVDLWKCQSFVVKFKHKLVSANWTVPRWHMPVISTTRIVEGVGVVDVLFDLVLTYHHFLI